MDELCFTVLLMLYFFFFKQKTAYEMRISDWSSDVCSSDLGGFTSENLQCLSARRGIHDIMAKFAKHIRQTLTNQILIVDHQNTKPIRRLQFHHITLMHFHRLFCGLSFRKPDRSNRPNPDDTFERQDRKSTRLNSSHLCASRMPSSA